MKVFAPGVQDEILLSLYCIPFSNKYGHVSVVSVHPYAVQFAAPSTLVYETIDNHTKKPIRQLGITALGTSAIYKRSISKKWLDGKSDTVWRCAKRVGSVEEAAVANGVITLPTEISVANGGDRVSVWRGPRPSSSSEAGARGSRDLLAHIVSSAADRGEISPDGLSQSFCLAVRPQLSDAAGCHAEVLPLFLAIAVEGYWSQGSANHAISDEVGIVVQEQRSDGANVRPTVNIIENITKGSDAIK